MGPKITVRVDLGVMQGAGLFRTGFGGIYKAACDHKCDATDHSDPNGDPNLPTLETRNLKLQFLNRKPSALLQ